LPEGIYEIIHFWTAHLIGAERLQVGGVPCLDHDIWQSGILSPKAARWGKYGKNMKKYQQKMCYKI
jgi:predicted secreted hydrolase